MTHSTRQIAGGFLAGLGFLWVGQLGVHTVYALARAGGEPSLSELRHNLASDSSLLLEVDLTRAERRVHDEQARRVHVPDAWRSGPKGRDYPFLMVFVDGDRIRFQRNPPDSQEWMANHHFAHYQATSSKQRVLIVRCAVGVPCRSANVVAADRRLPWKLARGRLLRHPGPLLASLALLGLGLFALSRVARARLWQALIGIALAIGCAFIWVSAGHYETSLSAPTLLVQVCALATGIALPGLGRTIRRIPRALDQLLLEVED